LRHVYSNHSKLQPLINIQNRHEARRKQQMGIHSKYNVMSVQWERTAAVIVRQTVDSTSKHKDKKYTEPTKLLFNFYFIYIILKCGREPHNVITWTAAGYGPCNTYVIQ
jgi:hypothetical protein